jgi:tetratricopeptide (TPR) repeat protein
MEYFNRQLANKDMKIQDALKEADAWRDKYIELTKRLAEAGTEMGLSLKAGELLRQGKFDEAGKLLDQAINSEEDDLDRLAADQYSRGVLYGLQFQPDKSLEHLEKAFRYRPDDLSYGHDYAFMLQHENRFTEAEEVYEEVIRRLRLTDRDSPGKHDERIAAALSNLGATCHSLRQYEKAEEALSEASQIYSRLAERDPKTYAGGLAMVQTNLGNLYADTARYELSEKAFHEVVDVYRKLAAENPASYRGIYGGALIGLAYSYMNRGDFSDARPLLEESLAIMRSLQRGRGPGEGLARVLGDLGDAYMELRPLPDAEPALQESLGIWRELAAADPQAYSPSLYRMLIDLGELYQQMGRYGDADRALAEALTGCRPREKLDPRVYRPILASTLEHIGQLRTLEGNFDAAEKAPQESLALRQQLALEPPPHYKISLGCTYEELGDIYIQRSQLERATSLYETSISILREIRGPEAALVRGRYALGLNKLAGLYIASKRWSEARPLSVEADGIYKELTSLPGGPSDYGVEVTVNLAQLAHSDVGLGRASDAKEDSQKAITSARQIKPTDLGYKPDLLVAILLDQMAVLIAANEDASKICALANEAASLASNTSALDTAKKIASTTCHR